MHVLHAWREGIHPKAKLHRYRINPSIGTAHRPRPLRLKNCAAAGCLACLLPRFAEKFTKFKLKLSLHSFLPTDSQRHLRELGRLDRSYHETLEGDRQEREVQVQVQKENSSLVVESLRRRYVCMYVRMHVMYECTSCLVCVHWCTTKTVRCRYSRASLCLVGGGLHVFVSFIISTPFLTKFVCWWWIRAALK